VDAGKQRGHADAFLIEENIVSGKIEIVESSQEHSKGDQALIDLFDSDTYSAVATDDAKLVRLLRIRGIPFILPALLIHRLWKRGKIRRRTATDALEKLKAFISEDEYSTVKILMGRKK